MWMRIDVGATVATSVALLACTDGQFTVVDRDASEEVPIRHPGDSWEASAEGQGQCLPNPATCAATPGSFGCHCPEGNAACSTEICVEAPWGSPVCSRTCDVICPPCWSCRTVNDGGSDLMSVCMPNDPTCQSCQTTAECGGEAVCANLGDGAGSSCLSPCRTDSDCGREHPGLGRLTCQTVGTAAYCLPPSGTCTCTESNDGQSRGCGVSSPHGTCIGKQFCDAKVGWLACVAPTPAADVCDLADNDCDGETDNADPLQGQPCAVGSCDGLWNCQGGELRCVKYDRSECCTRESDCPEVASCGPAVCGDDGQCHRTPGPCSDDDPCTVNDTCTDGGCVGEAMDCASLGAGWCVIGACIDGACAAEPAPDGDACDDGDACTAGDACQAGECLGQNHPCHDGNPCTSDACNGVGGCTHAVLSGAPCDDGSVCTVNDACTGSGQCAGMQLDCSDYGKTPCSAGVCDPAVGCMTQFLDAAPCDDGENCTAKDACDHGTCAGQMYACGEDGNPCTVLTCNGEGGCNAELLPGAPCDDGSACTNGDACTATGTCAGELLACADQGNPPCSEGACDPKIGCVTLFHDAAPCDDGEACTVNDACQQGICEGAAYACEDDGNPCTAEVCDGLGTCVPTPLPNSPCDDGSACTLDDHCDVAGGCIGTPKSCEPAEGDAGCSSVTCDPDQGCLTTLFDGSPCGEDDNPCTADMCHGGACTHAPSTGTCNDGNPCTENDACQDGYCVAGILQDCDDDNACTDDICNGAGGCDYHMLPEGAACEDESACTHLETCQLGTCTPGYFECPILQVNETDKGAQRHVDVAVLDDGTPLVVWASQHEQNRWHVMLRPLSAAGEGTVSGSEQVASTVSNSDGHEAHPSVAALDGGGAVIAWEAHHSATTDSDVVFRLYDAGLVPQGSEQPAHVDLGASQNSPAAVRDSDCGFRLVWSSQWGASKAHLYARSFDLLGAPTEGDEVLLTPTATAPDGPQDLPRVTALSKSGAIAVAYRDHGTAPPTAYHLLTDCHSKPAVLHSQILSELTDKGTWPGDVASVPGQDRALVVWHDEASAGGGQDGAGWGVAGRYVDLEGGPAGPGFLLLDGPDSAGNQAHPSVTVFADGSFVACFDSPRDAALTDPPKGIRCHAFAPGEGEAAPKTAGGDPVWPSVSSLDGGVELGADHRHARVRAVPGGKRTIVAWVVEQAPSLREVRARLLVW